MHAIGSFSFILVNFLLISNWQHRPSRYFATFYIKLKRWEWFFGIFNLCNFKQIYAHKWEQKLPQLFSHYLFRLCSLQDIEVSSLFCLLRSINYTRIFFQKQGISKYSKLWIRSDLMNLKFGFTISCSHSSALCYFAALLLNYLFYFAFLILHLFLKDQKSAVDMVCFEFICNVNKTNDKLHRLFVM